MNTYRATFACQGDVLTVTVEAESFDAAEVEARHSLRQQVQPVVATAYKLVGFERLGGAK